MHLDIISENIKFYGHQNQRCVPNITSICQQKVDKILVTEFTPTTKQNKVKNCLKEIRKCF